MRNTHSDQVGRVKLRGWIAESLTNTHESFHVPLLWMDRQVLAVVVISGYYRRSNLRVITCFKISWPSWQSQGNWTLLEAYARRGACRAQSLLVVVIGPPPNEWKREHKRSTLPHQEERNEDLSPWSSSSPSYNGHLVVHYLNFLIENYSYACLGSRYIDHKFDYDEREGMREILNIHSNEE